MPGSVRYEKATAADGSCVAVLTMDNAPVNALSEGVRTGLDERLATALADSDVKAIIVTGGNGAFCAGADISEFSKGLAGPPLPMVCASLEASTKPVVAAVDGVSLGGGCEVALGCHWRVASTRAEAGLPEVNLGLLPGAGGTQRLPRLIGAEKGIDFMCTGVPVKAEAAVKLGIYDTIVSGDAAAVLKAAVDFAASKVGSNLAERRLSTLSVPSPGADAIASKRKRYGQMRGGEVAPQAIITCIEASTDRPFDEGMKVEMKEFGTLLFGDQSRALQYMFFAERACSKVPGLTAEPGPLGSAGIVGAGLMGGGIAMCCAEAGMTVTLLDASQENLDKGMAVIKKNYARSVQRKSKTQAQVDKIMTLITPSLAYTDFAGCDIVIEAVFENMALKKEIFAKFDEVCKPGCILASNTSRLSIDEIATATKRPEDVVGCHFFSPANVMRLLENVRGAKTSPRTMATAMAFGKKIKKVTCLVGNCDGFVANRIFAVSGAGELLHAGVMPHEIDAAAQAFGMKMGPFQMKDLVGLDLFGRERAKTGEARPEKIIPDALFKAGRFGQKNGKGYYAYDEKLNMRRDPEAEETVKNVWRNLGVEPKTLSSEEIIDVVYLPVVNEGFKCLEEGIANKPGDVDVCAVFGYSWPRFTGGPMQWATARGLPTVLEKMENIGIEPAGLLKECVRNGWRLNSKEFQKRLAGAWSKL